MSLLNGSVIRRICLALVLGAGLWIVSGASAVALDPPASHVNPRTGAIEIADPVGTALGQDVHYVINTGARLPIVEAISEHDAPDRSPRLVAADNGDVWVVWWRELSTSQVLVRKRTHATSSWGAERQVGDPAESARNPDIAFDGTRAWVAYEIEDSQNAATTIAAGVIDDEPDPVGVRVMLGSTVNPGDRDVQIAAEGGAVWVSWIQSNAELGWSRYDAQSASWSLAAYEWYADDSIEAARARIGAIVSGN